MNKDKKIKELLKEYETFLNGLSDDELENLEGIEFAKDYDITRFN